MNIIPAYEIDWLQGIPHKYRTYTSALCYIYPVDLLPPTLSKLIKDKFHDTKYINMCETENMKWLIWGWASKPKYGGIDTAEWQDTILAEKGA